MRPPAICPQADVRAPAPCEGNDQSRRGTSQGDFVDIDRERMLNMRTITGIAASILALTFMAAAATPAAAQTIVSPPPGTDIAMYGELTIHGPTGGPGTPLAGPGVPGCPLIMDGKILSAAPGVVQVDSVTSCLTFTVPMFFRFNSATTGTIDLLEIGVPPSPNSKCIAINVPFTWSNPRYLTVPKFTGQVYPGGGTCRMDMKFLLYPDMTVI